MTDNPHIHNRRSIRLKGYDYAQEGLYFITLCTQNRALLFGNIENGEMNLNDYGRIVEDEWIKTLEIRKNIAIHEYVIMPNHFHAILEIKYPIESELKSFQKKREGELQFAPTENKLKSPLQTI